MSNEANKNRTGNNQAEYPQTIMAAVNRLINEMPLKNRVQVANMAQEDLIDLRFTLGAWIRNNFGLGSGNHSLKRECSQYHGESFVYVHEDEAAMIIIYEFWKKIQQTHRMRVVGEKIS